ncbi:MAG: NifU family protein [Dehalococcoidia bacterium]|nr:NifU family protein [Dehalococcoidia bacterium]
MRDRVQKVIDKMKPALAGTEVLLLDVSGGIVKVQVFASGCHPGPSKDATVMMLEEQLQEEIPEIEKVVAD